MTLLDLVLNKEDILELCTQEAIFSRLMGVEVNEFDSYINPLRNDRSPGCKFFLNDEGILIFHDHAKKTSYNWFTFARDQSKLIEYDDILHYVGRQMNIVSRSKEEFYSRFNITAPPQATIKKRKNPLTAIEFSLSPFREEHFSYWSTSDYKFTKEDFIKFRVMPIVYAKLIFQEKETFHFENPIGFIYFLTPDKKQRQVYFPLAEKSKKFRQLQKDNIFGFEYLEKKDHVILTKSYKDYIILKLAGFNSACILAENYRMGFDMYFQLKKYGRVYTLFDPDDTGITRSNELKKEFGVRIMYLDTEVKDPYGHYKKYGLAHLTKTVNNLIQNHQ